MLPPDADPVLVEAAQTVRELRRARRVAVQSGSRAGERREAQASASEDGAAADDDAITLARDSVRALEARLDALLDDPEARALIERALDERAARLRTAVHARRYALRQRELLARADALAAAAARDRRALIAAEEALQAELRAQASRLYAERADYLESRIASPEDRDGVLEALGALRIREARTQLRDGLLLTRQMRDIIAEAVPALTRGEPMLLLGETGGAKTALAEYLSRHELGGEPEFVSGYGDITSTQLVGAHELRSDAGATVSVFTPGPLLRAMTEGRPLILDEVNAMPPEFLKRLNRVLQLRAGDEFPVQENAGELVTIARGFVIIATANEQTPHRYRGLDRMSAELTNRFGANSYRVHYPDAGRRYTEAPVENALLAAAAIADREGRVPLAAEELERVSRAAFISQQVFAGSHGEGFSEFVSTEREIDGRPGLEESVLAPRTLVSILQKVAGSAGRVSLEQALRRFVEGVMHAEDRRVLAMILRSQGFLPD